jgi:hypothetical protein
VLGGYLFLRNMHLNIFIYLFIICTMVVLHNTLVSFFQGIELTRQDVSVESYKPSDLVQPAVPSAIWLETAVCTASGCAASVS